MATYSGCTGPFTAKVGTVTGGTRQDVNHALFLSNNYTSSGDTVAQCQTVKIGPDGLQN
jgi:hypothetical protein